MSVESVRNTELYNKSSILSVTKRALSSSPKKSKGRRTMPKSRIGVHYGFYPELSPGRRNKSKRMVSRTLCSKMVIEIT